MLRKIAVLAVLVVVVAAAFASAANLGVSGGTIQAGVDQSVYCDVNGVKVTGWGLETDDNSVRYVKVGDIDAACVGDTLLVKVLGAGGATLEYSGELAITGSEVKFSFTAPYPAPEQIEGIKIWIEGDK